MTHDIHSFAEELRRQIREEMNVTCDVLAQGAAADFAHYKQLSGTITGLALAERYLLDLQQKVKAADE